LAEELTESKIAFIHFVNDDEQTIELVAWSRATLAHYCRVVADTHHPVEKAGIWGRSLFRCNGVLPAGHAVALPAGPEF
jgi:two-component system sensor histidine kinase/response regulator